MKSLLFLCTISSGKAKESFTINSFNLIEESLGTKSVGLNTGQTSVMASCTLQSLYKI